MLVEKSVGREGMHAEKVLYGSLLTGWQIIMSNIVARNIILLDDILPACIIRTVGKIKINHRIDRKSVV